MVREGDKIKLKTGEIAVISEVLEEKVAYIAEIFEKDGTVSIDQIGYNEIASVYEEVEHPLVSSL